MSTPLNSDKFLPLATVIQRLKDANFNITQKELEKIIKDNNIDCFPIHGEWRIDYEAFTAQNDQIQKDLAFHYSNSNKNISLGQLRAKAIARGIMNWVASLKSMDVPKELLDHVQQQFINRSELKDPPESAQDLINYAVRLVSADQTRKSGNKVSNYVANSNLANGNPSSPIPEIDDLRDELTENMETLRAELLTGQQQLLNLLQSNIAQAGAEPDSIETNQIKSATDQKKQRGAG